MKKILVTGSSGLLGKSLTRRLLRAGHQLYALTHGSCPDNGPNLTYSMVDFSSSWSVDSLPDEVDVIIHLAQSPRFRDFPESALDVFNVNIESTARLLDYARRVNAKQFIYASSGGVYGNGHNAFKENAPIVPLGQLGYYLGSKACGEVLVQSYASEFQVGIIRPFFMYGPGQNRTMLMPRLYDSIKEGKPVTLQGSDGIRINPIHVEDAAKAVQAMLSLEGSATFNIAGPDVLSIRQICEAIGRELDSKPVFQFIDGMPNDLIADIMEMEGFLHCPERRLFDSICDLSEI